MKVFFTGCFMETKVQLHGELLLANYEPTLELFIAPGLSKALFHNDTFPLRRIEKFQVLSERAESIVLYYCQIAEKTYIYNQGHSMDKITIYFKYAIIQGDPDSTFKEILFSFTNIDMLFPYDEVRCDHADNNRCHITINPQIINHPLTALGDVANTSINSIITYSEEQIPFSLNYEQKKQMKIVFFQSQSINTVIRYIERVRKYFEFVLEHRISILDLSLKIEKNSFAKILYAPEINSHKAQIRQEYDGYSKSHLKYDDLMQGLNNWILSFERFNIAYDIWFKQLYNNYITIEDRILWNAQTIEYICQVEDTIYVPSKILANVKVKKNDREPNLKHYLSSLQNEYNILSSNQAPFFTDAKEVRDKITHNNPRKPTNHRKIKNTESLLYYTSRRLIGKLISLDKLPAMCCMEPQKNGNTDCDKNS